MPYPGTRLFKQTEKVGGFDEDIVLCEESTLPQKIEKLSYNVKARINAEILHCEEDFSVGKWLRKKYYYGKTASIYRDRYKDSKKQTSLLYRFSLFFGNKRFYSKPLLAFCVVTLKLLEYFSAGLGFLASKLRK